MNRPLKFRVWNNTIKYFVRNLNDEIATFTLLTLSDYLKNNSISNIDNFIFQQRTGLKDKNGKEIYEGDIIKEHHFEDWGDTAGYEYRGVVRYKMYDTSDVNHKFSGFITFPNELENKNYSGNPIHSDCEVIGNIFEHPELLK